MDYLAAREAYKLSYHKWLNMQQRLKELFHATDDGDLELAMLEARGQRRHLDLLNQYAQLSAAFDKAGDQWDTVQEQQARRTAEVIAQVNKDIAYLEC